MFARILFIILSMVAFSAAQERSFWVIVEDPNGGRVIGAEVIASPVSESKSLRQEKTNDDGIAKFQGLVFGLYKLEIKAPGFEEFTSEFEFSESNLKTSVRLKIKSLDESVEITTDLRNKALESPIGNFLTQEQIEALPDDPEELVRVLKQMAGGGDVVIKVDGFSSDSLPPKSQIASIRIVRSSVDAENHELGYAYVELTSKPGDMKFGGALIYDLRNWKLDARNPFSQVRQPYSTGNVFFQLAGPIKKNKASFYFTLIDSRSSKETPINAITENGIFLDTYSSSNKIKSFDGSIFHGLSQYHNSRYTYQIRKTSSFGGGVGGFNLPDRAFDQEKLAQDLRISESGLIAKQFFNEIRFRYRKNDFERVAKSDSPATIVSDAFSSGGAGNGEKSNSNYFYVADNFLFGFRNHSMKIGGSYEFEKITVDSSLNTNGAYYFTSIDSFSDKKPSLFKVNKNPTSGNLSNKRLSVYFQDDFIVKESFRVSAGLRYELQSGLSDRNNFSPRLGLAWSPFKTGKLNFRFGSGIYYRWFNSSELLYVNEQSNPENAEISIFNPVYLNPFENASEQSTEVSTWNLANDLANPYTIHLNFGFDGSLTNKLTYRANFTFQRGVHQLRARNSTYGNIGVGNSSAGKNVYLVESSASSTFNSLETGFDYSVSKDIDFGVTYTLSKTSSDTEGFYFHPTNSNKLFLDYGAANDDRRHRIYLNGRWRILKGLRLSAYYLIMSSLPYSHTTGEDNNNDSIFNDRPEGIARNSLRGNWNNQLDLSVGYAFSFIDSNSDDSGKNIMVVTTPSESRAGFDSKPSGKRFMLKFYASINNVFNHTNFTSYSGVKSSPFFRKPISASQPREILLGIKFVF